MDLKKIDLSTPQQKVYAGIFLGAVLLLLYFLLPPLVIIFKNLYILGALAAGIVFAALNARNIWQWFKYITWKITKNRVAADKLYYMFKYHEYALERIEELRKNIEFLTAHKIKFQRKSEETILRHRKNLAEAEKLRDSEASKSVIDAAFRKVKLDQDLIESFQPKIEFVKNQEKIAVELLEAMTADAEVLKYTLDNKKDEYLLLKESAEISNNMTKFLRGDSEEYKEYALSLEELEKSTISYLSTIENAQRDITPYLQKASAASQADVDMGKKLLEDYQASRVDFSKYVN